MNTTGAPSRSMAVPLALLVGGGIIYGTFFSANRIAVDHGVPSMALAFWQSLFGGGALLVVSIILRDLPRLSGAHLRQYGFTAIFSFTIPLVALTYAAPNLPAGLLTLVLTLTPALTYIFAFAARLEKFNLWSTGGLLAGLLGVVLIVQPWTWGDVGAGVSGIWFLVALVAPLGYAANNVVVALIRPAEATTLQLSTGVLVFATVVMFPFMLAIDGFYFFPGAGIEGIGATAWAGFTDIVIFLVLFEVIHRAGPVFFSQFNYIVLAAGIIWAFIIFQDGFEPIVWAAIACMAVGLYLANRGTNQSILDRAADQAAKG
ncbi:MAG: DMT family transporter [Proteobacteria bacterium]|nr:DMT family transporter [Pseudomonadota bacterium]MDA1058047.1 DMT family transporter [Pseudomonadota bacterium]